MKIRSCLFLAFWSFSALADEDQFQVMSGKLFPAISLASQYKYQGMSQSDNNPTLQLSLHWWRPDDFYAGIWMSNVDYLDQNKTRIELDSYIGRQFKIGDFSAKIELMHTAFNDDEIGPSYDFTQIKFEAERSFNRFSQKGRISWSREGSFGSGQTWQLRSTSGYQVSDRLQSELVIGRGFYENTQERNYYEFALSFKLGKLTAELRYIDMKSSLTLCQFVDWCEPALVGKLTLASY